MRPVKVLVQVSAYASLAVPLQAFPVQSFGGAHQSRDGDNALRRRTPTYSVVNVDGGPRSTPETVTATVMTTITDVSPSSYTTESIPIVNPEPQRTTTLVVTTVLSHYASAPKTTRSSSTKCPSPTSSSSSSPTSSSLPFTYPPYPPASLPPVVSYPSASSSTFSTPSSSCTSSSTYSSYYYPSISAPSLSTASSIFYPTPSSSSPSSMPTYPHMTMSNSTRMTSTSSQTYSSFSCYDCMPPSASYTSSSSSPWPSPSLPYTSTSPWSNTTSTYIYHSTPELPAYPTTLSSSFSRYTRVLATSSAVSYSPPVVTATKTTCVTPIYATGGNGTRAFTLWTA